jgi:hypothetical protein
MYNENCLAGGSKLPKHMINKKYIKFDNYPEDEKSLHILRLIAIHLPNLREEDKDRLIDTFNQILGIKKFSSSTISSVSVETTPKQD